MALLAEKFARSVARQEKAPETLPEKPAAILTGKMRRSKLSESSIVEAGIAGPHGVKRWFRLQKLLLELEKPLVQQIEADLTEMGGRLDALGEMNEQTEHRVKHATAFGWDYVALVRRVTVLEDLVEELREELSARHLDGDPLRTIPLPKLEHVAPSANQKHHEHRT